MKMASEKVVVRRYVQPLRLSNSGDPDAFMHLSAYDIRSDYTRGTRPPHRRPPALEGSSREVDRRNGRQRRSQVAMAELAWVRGIYILLYLYYLGKKKKKEKVRNTTRRRLAQFAKAHLVSKNKGLQLADCKNPAAFSPINSNILTNTRL